MSDQNAATAGQSVGGEEPSIDSTRKLSGFWRWALIVSASIVILLSVNQTFNLQFFVEYSMRDLQYRYLVAGLLLPFVFIKWPALASAKGRVTWYDALLFLLMAGASGYYAWNADTVVDSGWEYGAPEEAIWVSYLFWVLIVEACRRAGGLALVLIVGVVSLFPLYTEYLGGPFLGAAADLPQTSMFHSFSEESIFGIPMRAFTSLVLGFLIFGSALASTGAGKFFINFAFALLGQVRGGPAKVAIFSSGLMGSVSGSVVTNVLTTGVMSIPAMRRVGFGKEYAGGVETCASTGGVLMPPVMGATAFVMAVYLEVPYSDIVVAAAVPSVLYFFGLFVQIDAFAARSEMKGLPAEELPSLKQTLKEGWYYIGSFVLLIYMLLVLKNETWAPYFATAALLAANQIFPHNRWSWDDLWNFLEGTGRLFAELAGILAGVGLLIGALMMTGIVSAISYELVALAGDSVILLLIMGAATSFLLGIGMTVTAAYVFLAITLAPALVDGGINPMAAHLFIFYWGMLSFITPPVAIGAYAAATVAGAKPMQTGFKAMQLGSIIYFIPFFFTLNPALILEGTMQDFALLGICAVLGIVLIAGALQGYLIGVGSLCRSRTLEWPIRGAVGAAGLLLALPGGQHIPFSNLELIIAALVLLVPGLVMAKMAKGVDPILAQQAD